MRIKLKIYWRCIVIIGKRPKFLEKIPEGYYDKINPYVTAPSCKVNLLEMSRYAKRHNKDMSDLTKKEIEQFTI